MSFEHALEQAEKEPSPILLDMRGYVLAMAIHHELMQEEELGWREEKYPRLIASARSCLTEMKNEPKQSQALVLLSFMSLQDKPGGALGEFAYEIVSRTRHKVGV